MKHTLDEDVLDIESPRIHFLLYKLLQLGCHSSPVLQKLLKDVLAHDATQGWVGDLLDEFPNLVGIVSQFIDQFVGIDGSVVNHSLDLHRNVVLGYDLLWWHSEYWRLHVDLDDILTDWVDEMETWLQDLHIAAKGLMNAHFSCWDLVDGAVTATANAGTPDAHTPCKGPATL